MLSIGAPASHALNFIAFCTDDPSMGMFIGDGASGRSCDAEARAKGSSYPSLKGLPGWAA